MNTSFSACPGLFAFPQAIYDRILSTFQDSDLKGNLQLDGAIPNVFLPYAVILWTQIKDIKPTVSVPLKIYLGTSAQVKS